MRRDSQKKQSTELTKNGENSPGNIQNQDHGAVVDWHTRKTLKKTQDGINRNNKMIYITFFLEFVVFVLIIAAWASLSFT